MADNQIAFIPDETVERRFTAYLRTAVRNHRANYLRNLAVQAEHECPFPDEQYGLESEALFALEDKDALQTAMRKLDAMQRFIVQSHVLENQSFRQIAQACNMTCHTVAYTYYRTMQMLREILNESGFS